MLNLPNELSLYLRPHLGLDDLSRLMLTCMGFHPLYKDALEISLLETLQEGVLFAGKNAELEAKFKRIMQHRPDLLLKKSHATDGAKRLFTDNSPWQNALWQKDWHRWEEMLQHLPTEYYQEAYDQLVELEAEGRKHGRCYDATPLIKALENYLQKYDELTLGRHSTAEKGAVLTPLWCQGVGLAQRNMSIALVNQYCRKDCSFLPCPDFENATLPRTLELYENTKLTMPEKVSWFPLLSGLGTDFAILRGVTSPSTMDKWLALPHLLAIDLEAVSAWNTAGNKKLLALKQFLDSVLGLEHTLTSTPESPQR